MEEIWIIEQRINLIEARIGEGGQFTVKSKEEEGRLADERTDHYLIDVIA